MNAIEKNVPYSDPWVVGNRYSLSLTSSGSFDIENGYDWGSATDTNLSVNSAAMVVRIEAGDSSDERRLVVEDFSLEIPSFVHSATTPGTTGTNTFGLRSGYASEGVIDTTTGDVSRLRVFATLTNSHYSSVSPATVQIELTGSIAPASGGGTVYVDGIVYVD